MPVDQRSTRVRDTRSANTPAAADSTTYGSIRAAPAAPSQASLPVTVHTWASSAGQGIETAMAHIAWEISTRTPGERFIVSTVGSGAKPLNPTVE